MPSNVKALDSVTFKVFGYVKDAIGRPLAGVSVATTYITCKTGDCLNMTATTSATGYYQVTLASTGTIGLTASRSDLVTQSTSRTIGTASETQVDFTSLYKLDAGLSKAHHSPGEAPSVASISVTSFAPQPATGLVPSCVAVTDSRTQATTPGTLASVNPDGSSVWTWTLSIPQGAADGSHTLTVRARECGGEVRDLTQIRTLSYILDTTPPEILNLTPFDGQNTIFTSQPLQAEVRDPLAGIDATAGVSFTLTDRTSGAVTTHAATYTAATGIATSSSPAALIAGHDYTVEVRAVDRAGNAFEDGHRPYHAAGNSDNGGFRLAAVTGTPATGTISVSCPVTGDPVSRVATCSNVPLSMTTSAVTVPESRHSYDVAYVMHTFALTSAEIRAGVQSTNAYARRMPTGQEWEPRQVAYSYRIGDRLELPATFTASPPSTSLALGTLKVSVPSEWAGANAVTLSMQASSSHMAGGVLSTTACNSPLTASVPCSTDPLWSRFAVQLSTTLGDRAGLMARHRGWGADVVFEYEGEDVTPAYEAHLPPSARAAIRGDIGVTRVDAIRSKNLEDRYAPLLAELPAAAGTPSGTHLRWTDAQAGVTQEIALSPAAPSRLTVTPPFLGSADEPVPADAGPAPVDVTQITPVAPALGSDTVVRAQARSRARYESPTAPYWIEAMPIGNEGLRFVVQLRDATAPSTFDFDLSLPAGTTLIPGSNGSAVVVRDPVNGVDLPVGYFSPPFAYDADGRKVAVTQTITATSIRLALALTGSERFPIVADPTYVTISCAAAETYGSAAQFLRDNRHCPYGVTFVWAHGYWPKKARVAGDSTGYRHLREDGECSWVPDTSLAFDFQVSCRMHDYGYDLIRVKTPWAYDGVAKDAVDDEFRDAMFEHCGDRFLLLKPDCYRSAVIYYAGVKAFGNPTRHSVPSSWPANQFLANNNFTSGLTNWTKVGSGSLVAARDPNTGWYHAEMNCTTSGCGLYQDASIPNSLRGGETIWTDGQLQCNQTSGDCTYRLEMEFRRSDGVWIAKGSCTGSLPTHNPYGWYGICGVSGDAALNTTYTHVRYKLTSTQTGRRLRLRFPVVRLA